MPLRKDELPEDAIPLDRELRGVFKPAKDSVPKKRQKVAGAFEKLDEDNFNLVVGGRTMLGGDAQKDPLDGTTAEITKRKQVGGRPPKIDYTLPLTDELTGSNK